MHTFGESITLTSVSQLRGIPLAPIHCARCRLQRTFIREKRTVPLVAFGLTLLQ
jgi:hypothetical protein